MKALKRLPLWAALACVALISAFGAGYVLGGLGNPLSNDGPEAIEVGNSAFVEDLYEVALNAYKIAEASMPGRSEPLYNSANTLYRQERYSEAVRMYDELLTGDDLEIAEQSTYNAGNALYGAGEHEQAIEMYKQALRYNPNDADAKHNLELALAHRVEPQPPEQQQQPDQQQQDQQQPEPPPPQNQQQGEQQPDQQQEQQQGEQQPSEEEGEPQEGEEEGEPQEGEEEGESQEGDETGEPGEDESDWPIIPPSGMTEEQAMQLLESVGESSQPLRNAIQRRQFYAGPPPEQGW